MNRIISEDQLKALVEKWRGVRKGGFRAMDDYGFTVVEAVETCADELATILATAKRVDVELLRGWTAKRTDSPDFRAWVITKPDRMESVMIEDSDKSSGAVMLREIAEQLATPPHASSTCPICGTDTPHRHTGEEVARHRIALKAALGEGEGE
jgi:hypothetical protein